MQISELRKDLVSGDWIVIAPKRDLRPRDIVARNTRIKVPQKGCPFEKPEAVLLEVRRGANWSVQVIENKFPAFTHRDACSTLRQSGPYTVTDGIGHHDLLITRSHTKDFPNLEPAHAEDVFRAFQDRYRMLMDDPCIAYISMFHNWGMKAGASVYHPHYQMIAIPVVPPDFEHSLDGSLNYARTHGECVHCAMLTWEKKEKKRVIFENAGAIAFAPYVSRNNFEIRVFPKRHNAFFEKTKERELMAVAQALRSALRIMQRALHDPDYNFFIHTAPLQKKPSYDAYHWHIEILPKVRVSAGFELGTGIEITSVDPDDAARLLRGTRV